MTSVLFLGIKTSFSSMFSRDLPDICHITCAEYGLQKHRRSFYFFIKMGTNVPVYVL